MTSERRDEEARPGDMGQTRPATTDGGATAGRGSGQSGESVAHRGAHDLARGASEGADQPPAESAAERERRHEAEQIGE